MNSESEIYYRWWVTFMKDDEMHSVEIAAPTFEVMLTKLKVMHNVLRSDISRYRKEEKVEYPYGWY